MNSLFNKQLGVKLIGSIAGPGKGIGITSLNFPKNGKRFGCRTVIDRARRFTTPVAQRIARTHIVNGQQIIHRIPSHPVIRSPITVNGEPRQLVRQMTSRRIDGFNQRSIRCVLVKVNGQQCYLNLDNVLVTRDEDLETVPFEHPDIVGLQTLCDIETDANHITTNLADVVQVIDFDSYDSHGSISWSAYQHYNDIR